MDDFDRFLEEDIGAGDITTELLVPDVDGEASITCEDNAILAGLDEVIQIFESNGVDCIPYASDGDTLEKGEIIMDLYGPLQTIITVERTALNMMMRMSGIATATNNALGLCSPYNPDIIIAGTRKTTPGFRAFEKKAITIGGGDPHRYGLYDQILIKDNHIKAAGGVKNAMELVRLAPFSLKKEIEVENIEDAKIAADMGADIIMIDNTDPTETKTIRDAVKKINSRILIEVSGRLTADNACDYAMCADIISMGSLTHSVCAIHFSLDIL